MPPTVLVVEDDSAMAETIREVLIRAGYEVPEAVPTGERALEVAAQLAPSLVLMDVGLDGGMDGIEAAGIMRSRFGGRVLYITGATDDRTLQRAKETAPLGYLKKPFNARELRIAVEIALHQASLEAALAAREQWLSTTLQALGDAVVAADAGGNVTLVNRAAEALLGMKNDDAHGRPLEEVVKLVDPTGLGIKGLAMRAANVAEAIHLPREATLLGPSGKPIEVEGTASRIHSEGASEGTVIILRDVGARRRLEQRVGITDRLAAIGTMAAGMQHEINNPLATIVANVQFVRDALRVSGDNRGIPIDFVELLSALDDASVGAERVRRTVQELRHLSRADDPDATTVEISSALDASVRVAANALKHNATIQREYAATPPVKAAESQLSRVFVNIIMNAAEGGGSTKPRNIVLATFTDPQGRAVAEIRDDGPGVAADSVHRIFDPFFTRTPAAGDAGLRLTIAHGIVMSLGGEIEAESALGKGTTIRVSLPPAAARPKISAPPASKLAAVPPSTRPRVLVIDDEVSIGKAISRVIGREYDVTYEEDAITALDRLKNETFDVVFCDLMMPRMSGPEFFELLTERSPEQAARVVFLTGGAFSAKAEELLRTTRNGYLPKPFSRDGVVAAIRRIVEA